MNTEVKSTKSLIEKVSNKASSFMGSHWSLAIFPSAVFIFGIVNYIMFGTNPDTFSITVPWVDAGEVYSNSSNAWIGWTEITIATLGSTLTIFGVILTIRFDKRFVIPLVAGEILVVIDAIIVGYIFTALSYLLMIAAGIYNYIQWNKVDENNNNQMTSKLWLFISIAFTLYMIVGGTMILTMNNLSWLDMVSSGVVAASWFIMLRKNKLAFIGFLTTDIVYLIMFFSMGVWATGVSYLVYLCIDSTSFMSWITKD